MLLSNVLNWASEEVIVSPTDYALHNASSGLVPDAHFSRLKRKIPPREQLNPSSSLDPVTSNPENMGN